LRTTNTAELLLSGNAVGEMLKGMLLSGREKFLLRKCNENVDVAATRLFLAIRCYQQKHGKTPESLGALVPEFIDRIPADDFDGAPLRFSSEKKAIYSIGGDLIDSGGIEKDKKKQRLDIVFKLDFRNVK
jgi:hypothetical protein